MVKVLLVRHGNTFAPGDKVVWVGARTDLPLVPSGIAQAETLAAKLKALNVTPDAVLAGPLQRTRQHAGIAMPHPIADIRPGLREIDYGRWEAKSTEEIGELGGAAALADWDKKFIWPEGPGWSPSKVEIDAAVRDILHGLTQPLTMIVTSNGILRFFAQVAANAPPPGALKVGTGNACLMEKSAAGWMIRGWNLSPADLPEDFFISA